MALERGLRSAVFFPSLNVFILPQSSTWAGLEDNIIQQQCCCAGSNTKNKEEGQRMCSNAWLFKYVSAERQV